MTLTLADKQLTCTACGVEFPFTAEEQEFFNAKGFQEPRKCKPCRDAAKQNRSGGYDRPQRQLHDAVCAQCGVQTQVPFMPTQSKPVFCRDCFQNRPNRY